MDLERKTAVTGASIFFVLALVGFYAASLQKQPERKYSEAVNFTVNPEQEIVTARFDGRSLNLMRGGGRKARFYLDYDRDGNGFENNGELEGLKRDGKIRNLTEIVNFNGTNYRLYFRYSDDKDVEEDGWLTLFRVEEL